MLSVIQENLLRKFPCDEIC